MRDETRIKGIGVGGALLLSALFLLWVSFPATASAGVEDEKLYLALGDSAAAGFGDDPPGGGYVRRLGEIYETELGVTDTVNLAAGGATSISLIASQLDPAIAKIAEASDVRALTVTIGGNDTLRGCSTQFDEPSCPFRPNLATIFSELNDALEADPGEEVFTAMAYYNPYAGLQPQEGSYEIALVGMNDVAGVCDAEGFLGLNDVILQEAGKAGIPVADPYAALLPQGQALMAGDGLHLNAAGYTALVDSFLEPRAPAVCTGPRLVPDYGPHPGGGGPWREPDPVTDTTPPATKLTRVTPRRTTVRRATFGFVSSERGSTFECRLDRRRYRSCRPPMTLKRLKPGRHVFRVRAIDGTGNTDPTPAIHRFRVLK